MSKRLTKQSQVKWLIDFVILFNEWIIIIKIIICIFNRLAFKDFLEVNAYYHKFEFIFSLVNIPCVNNAQTLLWITESNNKNLFYKIKIVKNDNSN